jgi:hypothetical protein
MKTNLVHITSNVITIHGKLKRLDKFWEIQMFNGDSLRDTNVGGDSNKMVGINNTSDDDIDNYNTLHISVLYRTMFNVLVITNATNVGINKQIIHVIYCTSLSQDVPTMM